jgi:Mg/Co/Ni transporter MgtE
MSFVGAFLGLIVGAGVFILAMLWFFASDDIESLLPESVFIESKRLQIHKNRTKQERISFIVASFAFIAIFLAMTFGVFGGSPCL